MPYDETFKANWDWQARCHEDVVRVLRENAVYLLRLRIASFEEDTQLGADMVLEVDGGKVAVRLRRFASHKDKYRDFTIRSYNNGNMTELEKLRTGRSDVHWYLYGWMDQADSLAEWVLVDVPVLLDSGLLQKQRKEIPNTDGTTKFVAVALPELRTAGALIAGRRKVGRYLWNVELDGAKMSYTITKTPLPVVVPITKPKENAA